MTTQNSDALLTKQQLNCAANSISNEEFSRLISAFNIRGKLAIACSGGIDSLCLAWLAKEHFDIVALIIDHRLRKESALEAKQTSEILNSLGIENYILSEQRRITANIQSEARNLRYDLLLKFCKENQISTLATAHHADDNAETVLLKLSRGSGVDGLCGIAKDTEIDGIRIIRPFLLLSKNLLKATLEENNIAWVSDPTNDTDKYKRNKLRHALEEMEDAELITSRLNSTAENMQRVRDFLESETEKAYKLCIKGNVLNIDEFKKLHDEIAYRLLVRIIMEKANPRDNKSYRPRFEKIKSLKTALLANEVKTLSGLIFRPQKNKNSNNFVIALEKAS